jgi:hypothetical protein
MGAMTFTEHTVPIGSASTPFSTGYDAGLVYKRGILTGSSSYATGGDSLDPEAELGLSVVDDMLIERGAYSIFASGYSLTLAGTANAPLIIVTNEAGQIANATNIAAHSWYIRFYGKL